MLRITQNFLNFVQRNRKLLLNNMAKIISIINDKGGVSKTTTVMNLGTALWLLGKKVLLVDNDPQSNLTLTLDKTAMQTTCNLYTWMLDRKSEVPVYTRYDGFDYIPGSRELGQLEEEIKGKAGSDRYLDLLLKAISRAYDYILIDCAPGGKTLVNMNALEASDEVIIPVRTDLYSVAGRGILMDKIDEIRELQMLSGKPDSELLRVAGVLLTQFDKRTEMARNVKEYFKTKAKEDPAMPLFPMEVRKCEAVNKAPGSQMSIYEHDANSTAADDYMRLAEYLAAGCRQVTRKITWDPSKWSTKAMSAYNKFIENQQKEA